MINFIISLFLVLMVSSCSSVEFNTSGRELFFVGARSGSERIVDVKVTKDFFFWGLSPSPDKSHFDLQAETEGFGISNASYISIQQSFSVKNIFFTLLTLGVYSPVDYQVTLLSKGESK